MSIFSHEELQNALKAENELEQFPYITKIESACMKQESFQETDLTDILTILSLYLSKETKRIRQRSLALILSLSKFKIPQNVALQLVQNIILCFLDSRPNIRQLTFKVCNAIASTDVTSVSAQLFVHSIGQYSEVFPSDSRPLILTFLISHKLVFSADDWSILTSFIIMCLDEKPNVKASALEILKEEKFLLGYEKIQSTLSPSQKKIINQYVEKNTQKPETNEIHQRPDFEKKESTQPITTIVLNTSPFSRQLRQTEMNENDGIRLLTEPSFHNSFVTHLSLDIRDVFDDDVAEKLLSKQSSERLAAVNILKDIFTSSQNFEFSIDLIFRWCALQFIGRHINIAQAALSLLLEQMGGVSINDNENPHYNIDAIELDFIVPIVLWCIATTSTAYNDLLRELQRCSSPVDYGNALLLSLQLHHSVIVSQVFDEINQMNDISGLENRLRETAQSHIPAIREKANSALFRLSPASPRKGEKITTTDQLKSLIQKIKSQPDYLGDGNSVFQILLQIVEISPSDDQTIRYLLYGLYSFLSEPILTSSLYLNQNDLISLITPLCNFALKIGPKFSDALNAVGFVFSTLVEPLPLFQELVNYIDEHYDTITSQSFPIKLFQVGISLLGVHQRNIKSTGLSALRNFARQVGNRKDIVNHKEDDIRWSLIRNLMSEIVTFEQMKREDQLSSTDDEDDYGYVQGIMNKTNDKTTLQNPLIYGKTHDKETGTPKRSSSPFSRRSTPKSTHGSAIKSSKAEKSVQNYADNTISIDILERLSKPSTKADAIQQLINEDKLFVLNILAQIDVKSIQRECLQAKRNRSVKRRNSHD